MELERKMREAWYPTADGTRGGTRGLNVRLRPFCYPSGRERYGPTVGNVVFHEGKQPSFNEPFEGAAGVATEHVTEKRQRER